MKPPKLLCTCVLSLALTAAVTPLSGNCSSAESVEVVSGKELKWSKPLCGDATDMMEVFTHAMKGKPTKEGTKELMHGVTELTFEEEGLMFKRADNARLLLLKTSEEGEKLTKEWDKAQRNAEKQFGPSGKEFLQSIQTIKQSGDRIEIVRTGKPELLVDLGKKKLHHAFDLKAIRFSGINFALGEIKGHPALMDLNGVTVLINAPGFTLPVQVKQFCKWKKTSGETEVTVGVKPPLPGAIRALLFLPKVVQFHFIMPKKPEDQEDADTTGEPTSKT
jgi:hypothetical protein